MRRLRAAPIGLTSAWLPSRKSTLHHTGGAVMVLPGQVRSGRSMGVNGRYLSDSMDGIARQLLHGTTNGKDGKPLPAL